MNDSQAVDTYRQIYTSERSSRDSVVVRLQLMFAIVAATVSAFAWMLLNVDIALLEGWALLVTGAVAAAMVLAGQSTERRLSEGLWSGASTLAYVVLLLLLAETATPAQTGHGIDFWFDALARIGVGAFVISVSALGAQFLFAAADPGYDVIDFGRLEDWRQQMLRQARTRAAEPGSTTSFEERVARVEQTYQLYLATVLAEAATANAEQNYRKSEYAQRMQAPLASAALALLLTFGTMYASGSLEKSAPQCQLESSYCATGAQPVTADAQ